MRTRLLAATFFLVPLAVGSLTAQAVGIREVSASDRQVIPLTTKLRYTTMILLPDDEEILDVVCGDKDFWVISAAQNIAHVKPAKEGAATNLNLVTASGTIYSFVLTEGAHAQPDLKVYVNADTNGHQARPKYYSAAHVEVLQTQLAGAQAAIEAAQRHADEAITGFRAQYPTTLQFAYGMTKYEKPFYVRSIWHDDQFTYIKSDARELPALYELKDDQPTLVNFQVQRGMYVVPKVIERGYLAIGKKRFAFEQGR